MNEKFIGMRLSFFLLATILLLYGLIMARDFLYPLALGVLISYLLFPIVNFLEKKGVSRILSIMLPLLVALAVFVFLFIFITKRISIFMEELPYFKEKTIEHIGDIQQNLEHRFGIPSDRIKNFLITQLFNLGAESGKLFTATAGTIFAILMQPVFIFLFLYYRTKFAYFILKIAGKENRQIAINILREIAQVVTRYMLGVTMVVVILCFVNSAGYIIIGIEYPVLLGVIAALFSFIPYFGTLIGGSIPFLFALVTEDSLKYSLRILLFVYIINFIENNILTPNIVGNNIRLNPFIIILGLIAGAMIWGIPGMLVTVPFLAMLKIILKKIPGMQPYAYLLGTKGTSRHELTFKNAGKSVSILKDAWKKITGR
jgi:predicted PurR-regulated permease PerM